MENWRTSTNCFMKEMEEDLGKSADNRDGEKVYLENQSGRSNIIIDDVLLEKDDKWEMSQIKVQEVLGNNLDIEIEPVYVPK